MANETKPETVTIELPDSMKGMTPEQVKKAMDSFEKQKVQTAKRDKATRKALTDLKDKYPADFKTFYAKRAKEEGLSVS